MAKAVYVDLFCGGGGSTTGALRAMAELGLGAPGNEVRAIAVNHDQQALETHGLNHPLVEHINCDIERLDPAAVLGTDTITILWASAPCQDWSKAAGGPCTRPQQRATPAYIIQWLRIGRPKTYIEENVWEITERWADWPRHIEEIEALGYRVAYKPLDAANYGVPQNRERMILVAQLGDGPIVWPKQTHSNPKKPVAGTLPWVGAITALDLTQPCPSLFGRTTKAGKPKLHKPKTRRRIARYIREQGPFWEQLAVAVEEGTGPVPLAAAIATCPVEQWPTWLLPCGDHVHIHPPLDPHLTKFYGTGRGQPVTDPSGAVLAGGDRGGGHLGVVQPQFRVADPAIVPVTHGDESRRYRSSQDAAPTVTGANRGELAVADFTLGQQGGAAARSTGRPSATIPTAGFLRVGEIRCLLDTYDSKGPWRRHRDPERPIGSITCSPGRWDLVEARAVMAPEGIHRGNVARTTDRPSPSIGAERGGQTREIEVRVATDKACMLPQHGEAPGQLPRIHRGKDPGPTITTSYTPSVAFVFVYTYNGRANCRDVDAPNTTLRTVEGHAILEVRLDDLYLDVGLRMLTVRELANLQTFPRNYQFAGKRKGDVTRQIGNAVPCDLATAIVLAAMSRQGMVEPTLGDYGAPEVPA